MNIMKTKHLILFLISALSADASAKNRTIFFEASAFYNTEPINYDAFTNEWDGHFFGGRKAIALSNIETGGTYNNWRLSIFQRTVSYLDFSSETAEIVYLTHNKLPLEKNRRYKVDLTVKHMISDGVRIGRNFINTNKFRLNIGSAILSGKKIFDGKLTGYVHASSESDYNFENVYLDYYYSKDKLFAHDAENPSGVGLSFDSELEWKPNNQIVLTWYLGDIFAFIDWQDAPTTTAFIDSDNKTYDENGYVKIEPLIRGHQSEKQFRQQLPIHSNLKISSKLSATQSLILAYQYTDVTSFAEIGLSQQIGYGLNLSTSYILNVEAFSFSIKHRIIHFQLAMDELDIKKTRYLNFTTSLNYPF